MGVHTEDNCEGGQHEVIYQRNPILPPPYFTARIGSFCNTLLHALREQPVYNCEKRSRSARRYALPTPVTILQEASGAPDPALVLVLGET